MTSIDRRTVLATVAAGAAAGLLTACTPKAAPATGVTPPETAAVRTTATTNSTAASSSVAATPSSSASDAPDLAAWKKFAGTVKGSVELPGSGPYARDKLLFDPEFDHSKPAAVLRATSVSDISRTMAFAADHGLQVAARSGGHSYVGGSAANGTIVIDMRQLARVTSTRSTATVEAGAGLYAVHAALSPKGLTVPTGTCPTVGSSGYTLGGGIGTESRSFGLTCDQLQSLQFVLPDGSAVTASTGSNSDLFWAARGGSSTVPGIVTSMKFATHAATDRGTFRLTFPAASASSVAAGWGQWLNSADRAWWANVHLDLQGGVLSPSVVGVTPAGQEGLAAAALIRAIGVSPSTSAYTSRSYLATVQYLGGGITSARTSFVGGSDVITTMDAQSVSAILQGVHTAGARSVTAILDPLDGAVHDVTSSASAFPWRAQQASVQWYSNVPRGDYAAARTWITAAHREVFSVSAGAYVNYVEAGVSPDRYFGPNRGKLASIRQAHDPGHRVHSPITP
ncbi:MAG: FAD-binding oxidoreductase [Actinomycetota bacterium]|nr:FAD-binding oxidoreductase [Actinomycetota bacterium]